MWEPLDGLKPQDLDDFGAAKVTFAQTQIFDSSIAGRLWFKHGQKKIPSGKQPHSY
jgi:hypothetical protein